MARKKYPTVNWAEVGKEGASMLFNRAVYRAISRVKPDESRRTNTFKNIVGSMLDEVGAYHEKEFLRKYQRIKSDIDSWKNGWGITMTAGSD